MKINFIIIKINSDSTQSFYSISRYSVQNNYVISVNINIRTLTQDVFTRLTEAPVCNIKISAMLNSPMSIFIVGAETNGGAVLLPAVKGRGPFCVSPVTHDRKRSVEFPCAGGALIPVSF